MVFINGLIYLFFFLFVVVMGMKWVEVKMKELGVIFYFNYKICFMLDSLVMISVYILKYGVIEVIIKFRFLVKLEVLG